MFTINRVARAKMVGSPGTRRRAAGGSAPQVRANATGTGGLITLPTNVAGDVLVFAIEDGGSPLWGAVAGWTQVVNSVSAGTGGMAAYWKVAGASEANPLVAGVADGAWSCYSVGGASGVDNSAVSGVATGTALTGPSATATGPGRLLLSFAAVFANLTITMPAGQTVTAMRTSAALANGIRSGYETVAAGATGTRAMSVPSSAGWDVSSVLVK